MEKERKKLIWGSISVNRSCNGYKFEPSLSSEESQSITTENHTKKRRKLICYTGGRPRLATTQLSSSEGRVVKD